MSLSKRSFAILVLVFFQTAQAGTQSGPGGVRGRYSDWLDSLLSSGSYQKLVAPIAASSNPLQLTCLETPGRKHYVGVVQNMVIRAPIARVQSVVEDFGSYAHLFPGYDAIRVESRTGDRILTYWESHVPVFFIPNVKYRMIYQLGTASPDTKIYRYELEKAGDLRESDGFIVLKKTSPTETHYLEVDFFDANWGIVETLAPGKIWPESADGIYESDLAFLLKSEHPDWSNDRCRKESVKKTEAMDPTPGTRCSAARTHHWSSAFPGLSMPVGVQ